VLVRERSARDFIPSDSTWALLLALALVVVCLAQLFTPGVVLDTRAGAALLLLLGVSTAVVIGTGIYKATTFARRRV